MELKFDKKIFNNGYAWIYTVVKNILAVGFLLFVVTIGTAFIPGLSGVSWGLPTSMGMILGMIEMIGAFGFPIVAIARVAKRRGIEEGTLTLSSDRILYSRLIDRSATAVGVRLVTHMYEIDRSTIKKIERNRRFVVIHGKAKKIINRNNKQDVETVSVVKIPVAFEGMERFDGDEYRIR